jgi:hypothetical protein
VLSQNDLQALEKREIFTKLLDTDENSEVAVLGVMHVAVPVEFFVGQYRDIRTFMKTDQVVEVGEFSDPPQMKDLQGFTLEHSDFLAIQECEVGDCDVKLPASMIERFRQDFDWSADDSQPRLEEQVRQVLVDYVTAYKGAGNAAMGRYDDQKYPLIKADEFSELLQEFEFLYDYEPKLHTYLEAYPQSQLPNADNFIYWSQRRYERIRPIVSIDHVAIFRGVTGNDPTLIASKQIYASHYFEASLELSALVKAAEGLDSSGFYLLYLNRSRLDSLRKGGPPGMRNTIRGEMLKRVGLEMQSTKARMEALYAHDGASAAEAR